ncbi:hypothetical protein F2P81_017485 [Scophthalmus maximus]|uniref:Uncharacterized protein n=1 Tax=Scophthalmus maximus TaxID=52904 RepID=A0A6A4SIF6_SCOMX|nr:hypothetical protein F2P81_017485 [Scophthalmus maximus]
MSPRLKARWVSGADEELVRRSARQEPRVRRNAMRLKCRERECFSRGRREERRERGQKSDHVTVTGIVIMDAWVVGETEGKYLCV